MSGFKIKNIFKIPFMVFVVFISFFLFNNVKAYQLQYSASGNQIVNGEKGVFVITMGNSYGGKPGNYEYNTWYNSISDNNRSSTSGGNYSSYKLIFHSKERVKYKSIHSISSNTNDWEDRYFIGYDKTKPKKTMSVDKIESGFDCNKYFTMYDENGKRLYAELSKQDTSVIELATGRRYDISEKNTNKSGEFYAYQEAYSKAGDQDVVFTKWFISNKFINDARKTAGLVSKDNKVFFSLPAETHTTYDVFATSNSNEMPTAMEAVEVLTNKYKNLNNWNVFQLGMNSDQHLGQTIINLYDNILELPKIEDAEAFVEHVDESGNQIGGFENKNAIYVDDSSILANTANGTNNKISGYLYQEYYKFDSGRKLRLRRTDTIYKDGYEYELKETWIGSGADKKTAKNNLTKQKSAKEIVTTNENNKATVVKFVYKKKNPPSEPNGKIATIKSESDSGNCSQAYTPTGQDITPYLIANKFKIKNLKYNVLTKEFVSMDIDVLDHGIISNNEGVTGGTIFGGNYDYHTLLNGNKTSEDFILNNNLYDELKGAIDDITHPDRSDYNGYIAKLNNFTSKKTTKDDFTVTKFKVPDNRYNGLRQPKLTASYVSYHVDSNRNITKGGSSTQDCKNIFRVIVYNEIVLKDISVTSSGVVDQTTEGTTTNNVMQKNADFSLSFGAKESIFYGNKIIPDTGIYVDHYYIVFDIDVILNQDVLAVYNSNNGYNEDNVIKKSGNVVPAKSWIKVSNNSSEFRAKASSGAVDQDIVSQVQNKVMVIAVAGNIPKNNDFKKTLEEFVLSNETAICITNTKKDSETRYINKSEKTNKINFTKQCDVQYTEDNSNHKDYYIATKMYEDAWYMVKATATTENIGRIYDFKITDCSDIDYKSVFRRSSTINSVNDLTGITYFSGIKRLDIYSNDSNTLVNRDGIDISNSASKLILPLGPYKNTNISYVAAPKLGYRISFDLKTSGLYNPDSSSGNTRVIEITPSYYYLSKKGDIKDNIQLYYKNSQGKYVNLENEAYTMYFKPNDGYRFNSNLKYTNETKYMSDKLQAISVSNNKSFELNKNMMSINSSNNFIQAWYGEFKLPNSTIVAENNNISKPLSDGYIGVKFNIKCVDKNKDGNVIRTISYNQNNRNDKDSSGRIRQNTTQWDYEGYLGFNSPGNEANGLKLQLENGTLNINNDIYNKIKGTVVLFDIDNRAANDFD